jgi:16S rRNA G527 N7-methylase RsmG
MAGLPGCVIDRAEAIVEQSQNALLFDTNTDKATFLDFVKCQSENELRNLIDYIGK